VQKTYLEWLMALLQESTMPGGRSVHGVKKLLLRAMARERRPRLQNALTRQFVAVVGMYM
jgi:hypothetical protein